MYGSLGDDVDVDESRTKITRQQKTKFFLHWVLLLFVHCFVFWWIPVTGNYILYGSAFCDASQAKKYPYGCRNFHDSTYLVIFYALCCVYFMLSSLQIRHGFPIMKKASSILQYNEDALALLGAQVYAAIPFAIEIRCLLDFTFSKTSLDIFQFWQLFQYHLELYLAKNGNYSYVVKPLGSATGLLDKLIFGWLISSLLLLLLFGPIFFFSEFGAFIQENPVKQASLELSFVVNKTLSEYDLEQRSISRKSGGAEYPEDEDEDDDSKALRYTSTVPYAFFTVKHPNLNNYT